MFAELEVHAMSSGDKWMIVLGLVTLVITVIGCTYALGIKLGGMKQALDTNTEQVKIVAEHSTECDPDRAEQRVRTEGLEQWVKAVDERVNRLQAQ